MDRLRVEEEHQVAVEVLAVGDLQEQEVVEVHLKIYTNHASIPSPGGAGGGCGGGGGCG